MSIRAAHSPKRPEEKEGQARAEKSSRRGPQEQQQRAEARRALPSPPLFFV
jgi:hypothetical protein